MPALTGTQRQHIIELLERVDRPGVGEQAVRHSFGVQLLRDGGGGEWLFHELLIKLRQKFLIRLMTCWE